MEICFTESHPDRSRNARILSLTDRVLKNLACCAKYCKEFQQQFRENRVIELFTDRRFNNHTDAKQQFTYFNGVCAGTPRRLVIRMFCWRPLYRESFVFLLYIYNYRGYKYTKPGFCMLSYMSVKVGLSH